MERQEVTAAEIRAAILEQIHHLDGDCGECAAPAPVPLDTPDETGCNWRIHFIPSCPSECLGAVEAIVNEAKARFNLR